MEIKEKDINKEIYFLSDTNLYKYYNFFNKANYELNNKNTIIIINNEREKEFKKYIKSDKIGKYKIKILIKDDITNMRCMFYGCNSLTNINLSSLNTNNINNICFIFPFFIL